MIYAKWIEQDQRFSFALEDNGGVEITEEFHKELIDKASNGHVITKDSDGKPKLVTSLSATSLSDLKEQRKDYINRQRDIALTVGVEYNDNTFDSDDKSISNVIGTATAVLAGVNLPNNFTWRSKDNQNIPFSPQDVVGLGAVLMAHQNIVYQKSWALKELIDSKTTKNAVNSITWDSL